MLKKKDLVKDFELVVKQEIKNYQDSLNFILESLREIKGQIEKVKLDCFDEMKKIKEDQQKMKIEFDLLFCKQKEKILSLESFQSKNSNHFDKIQEHALNAFSTSVQNQNKIEYNQNLFDRLCSRVEDIDDEIRGHSIFLHKGLENNERKIHQGLKQLKKELDKHPCQIPELKKELEEQIQCHKVDTDGILREIKIFKKENFITEKKMEHLFTQLERLKEKMP